MPPGISTPASLAADADAKVSNPDIRGSSAAADAPSNVAASRAYAESVSAMDVPAPSVVEGTSARDDASKVVASPVATRKAATALGLAVGAARGGAGGAAAGRGGGAASTRVGGVGAGVGSIPGATRAVSLCVHRVWCSVRASRMSSHLPIVAPPTAAAWLASPPRPPRRSISLWISRSSLAARTRCSASRSLASWSCRASSWAVASVARGASRCRCSASTRSVSRSLLAALRASHAAAYSPVAILIFTRWFSAWTLADTCGARGTGRRDVSVGECQRGVP